MNIFIEGVLFVAGLAFGSFLNVCITRIPRDESIVRPRSHCRECGQPIGWRDNIPVLSFLLLRGRCRACRATIPYRYPLVELLTAVVFALCYQWYGPAWITLKFCILAFLLIGLIFMDAETGLLPHEFTYPGIVLGLALSWPIPFDSSGTSLLLFVFRQHIESVRWLSLLDSTLGALLGAAFFYLAWAMYYLARKRHGLGFGDIALIAMSGAFLGLKLNVLVLVAGPILTVMYIVVLLVRVGFRPRSPKQVVPAPAGAAVLAGAQHAACAGDEIPAPNVSQAETKSAQPAADAALEAHDEPPPFLERELPFGVFLGICALLTIFFGEAAWTWYLGKFR